MDVELFPFAAVARGARVVLYGFGNVGQQYFAQLEKTGYATVVAVADRRAEALAAMPFARRRGLAIVTMEGLCALPQASYDCVVLAISNRDVAVRVADALVRGGVARERIVYALAPSFLGNEELHACLGLVPPEASLFETPDAWASFLNDMMTIVGRPWQHAGAITAMMDAAAREPERLLALWKAQLASALAPKARLLVLNMMYKRRCFDQDCLRLWMRTLAEMTWDDDTPYFCVICADIMGFHQPEILYPAYYEERRALLRRICTYYDLQLPEAPPRPAGKLRVVFTLHAFWEKSAICLIAKNYMQGFRNRGCEVKAVVLSTMDDLPLDHLFLHPFSMLGRAPEFMEKWTACMGGDIPAVRIDDLDIKTRLQHGIDEICAFSPDIIFDMADEFFPAAAVLQPQYPILYAAARGLGTSAIFDGYLARDAEAVAEKGIVPRPKIRQAMIYNYFSERSHVTYHRAQFGLQKDNFVMITLGTRLYRELRTDFLDMMCALLDEEPRAKWLIVQGYGTLEIDHPAFRHLQETGKIILRGYEDHLESLFQLCDVLVEMDRQGGASAIRRAMMAGLPVAMTDFPSDNLPVMQGHVVHGGYRELKAYLLRLLDDPAFCASEGAAMHELMQDASPQADADKVLAICEDMVEERKKHHGVCRAEQG